MCICTKTYTYIYTHPYRLSGYPPASDSPHCKCKLAAQTLKLRNRKSRFKLRIFLQPGYQDQVVEVCSGGPSTYIEFFSSVVRCNVNIKHSGNNKGTKTDAPKWSQCKNTGFIFFLDTDLLKSTTKLTKLKRNILNITFDIIFYFHLVSIALNY